MKRLVAAATFAFAWGLVASAQAQNANACLILNNAWYTPSRDKMLSFTIDGYSGFWSMRSNNTLIVSLPNGDHIRGASFAIHIFDDDQARGPLIENSTSSGPPYTPHTVWTWLPPGDNLANRAKDCEHSGAWLVLVHE